MKDIAFMSIFLTNTNSTIFHTYQKLAIEIENDKIKKNNEEIQKELLERGRETLNRKSF